MASQNHFLRVLEERITQLFYQGLEKIWMRAIGNDEYHIANVFGIDIGDLEVGFRHSGMAKRLFYTQ